MVDFLNKGPSVPEWLTKLSKTVKYLPVGVRKKMLPWVVNKLKETGMLESLVGKDLVKGAGFMADFLAGHGNPRELNISDKDWLGLIEGAEKYHIEEDIRYDAETGKELPVRWTPSTNPEFHSKEGWEWRQIEPSYKSAPSISTVGSQGGNVSHDLYNILGKTTTLRRRPAGEGKYEYQIAEDFDLSQGDRHGHYETGDKYRILPKGISQLVQSVFPEYTGVPDEGKGRFVGSQILRVANMERSRYRGGSMGKPVPVVSKYMHSTKIEDKLVDRFKNDENFSLAGGY